MAAECQGACCCEKERRPTCSVSRLMATFDCGFPVILLTQFPMESCGRQRPRRTVRAFARRRRFADPAARQPERADAPSISTPSAKTETPGRKRMPPLTWDALPRPPDRGCIPAHRSRPSRRAASPDSTASPPRGTGAASFAGAPGRTRPGSAIRPRLRGAK